MGSSLKLCPGEGDCKLSSGSKRTEAERTWILSGQIQEGMVTDACKLNCTESIHGVPGILLPGGFLVATFNWELHRWILKEKRDCIHLLKNSE